MHYLFPSSPKVFLNCTWLFSVSRRKGGAGSLFPLMVHCNDKLPDIEQNSQPFSSKTKEAYVTEHGN